MFKKQLKSLCSSAKMYKNGVTPNKEALHGAFLLNKYIFISMASNEIRHS